MEEYAGKPESPVNSVDIHTYTNNTNNAIIQNA